MKKLNRLFAILIAVLGVGSLSAQTWTDVTSTYIKNPTLIASYYGSSDNTAWPVYTTGRTGNTQHPKEWILHTNGTTNHNIGGAFFECWAPDQGVKRWTLFQDVTLPAGKYKLTGKYSTNENRGIIKTVAITPHHSFYSPGITTGNWGSWGAETAEFTIYEETQVRVGMISTNFAQCNGFTLTTSGAKQLLSDEIDAAPEELTEAIAAAQDVYDKAGADDVAYRAAAKVLNEAIVAYNIDNASEDAPVDMTGRISNPSFEGVGGATAYTGGSYNCPEWTYPSVSDGGARSATHNTYLNIDNTSDAFYCFNIWNGSAVNYTVSQTLSNMPAGVYNLTACYASDAQNTATLYLNSSENGKTMTATGKEHFVNGSVTYKLPVDGNLVIGLTSSAWYKADDFKLFYLGADLSDLEAAFSVNYSNLDKLATNNVPTAFADKIESLKSTYATTPTNKKGLQTANSEISAIVSAHPSIEAAFGNLTSFIELCTEYTDNKNSNANSADVLETFQAAINTATTAGNAATSVDVINTAYNDLENARRIYAQNAVPVYPYAFDMTFLLTNPNFDSNVDGWAANGAGRMSAGNIECYNNTFTFALANKLTGLGNGTWEVSVDGFYRYGGYNEAEAAHNGSTEDLKVKFYANANEVALKSIMEGANKAGGVGATTTGGVRVPNSPADGNSYFPTGCYSNTVSTLVTDGTLTFGLKKESTQGSDWTLFDNFRLVYKGVDVSELQNSLSALITKANAIKETKMGNTAKTTLTNALNAADATVTNADELNEMLSTLQSAYDVAMASIDTYSKVPAYIAKAKAIGVTLADTYQAQYDNNTIEGTAETVFQALEVATYSYVKETFPYDVELLKAEDWNSKGTNTAAETFNNEHWSGTTSDYKNQQDGDNWGWGASAWSIDFDQSVTLPAGEYVFKVAGRKSAEATLELTVTVGAIKLGSVNDFPSSNNAKGINKAGVTSFDANDPEGFANNGNGFGWQWRYVKFALETESTVKVAVHAETNAIHQWVSFGDYTLHMDESAYLETNKEGLVAPMAAAQALVGVKPMGKDEATALQTAIDMPVTTGAELKAKIDALNTAVDNANAWVPKYNEAKAPLVAALDRFEADYNDAQNGALNHMNKDRWATAISMAQAAAVAKDATDSYDGFETATNNLVAALEAATTSVNEYSALDAAIETVSSLYLGDNWGDQAFQRPTSAKESLNTAIAQNVYDAATADGEGVTSVTEALNNGLNGIVINEPAEGDVFKLAISFNKDWKFNLKPLTFADNGTSGVSMFADRDANFYAQTIMLKKVEGNKYTMSTIAANGTELYVSTGSTSGHGNSNVQIRLTDDKAKALSIEVIPTATEGLFNLKNTEAGALLGCQDPNEKETGGLYTTNNRNNFTITKVDMPSVTLNTPNYWGTLILPFAAEIPENLTVYSCEEADGEVLTLETVQSIEANTPYLVCGQTTDFEHTFTGFGAATTTSYTAGLFTGTYVDYKTTANSGTYVLQKNNGDVAFYLVGEGENAQPTVGANRCYMTYDDSEESAAQAQVFRLVRGGTTSIDNMESTGNGQQAVVIYDLMGRKVSTMEKGKMYIVNGVKVLIK